MIPTTFKSVRDKFPKSSLRKSNVGESRENGGRLPVMLNSQPDILRIATHLYESGP